MKRLLVFVVALALPRVSRCELCKDSGFVQTVREFKFFNAKE